MHSRLVVLAFLIAVTASAKTVAPPTIPHPMAMYLSSLSSEGKDRVSFRAMAIGTHFFLEESGGVTVYVYDESVGYRTERFLKGLTLPQALKRYK